MWTTFVTFQMSGGFQNCLVWSLQALAEKFKFVKEALKAVEKPFDFETKSETWGTCVAALGGKSIHSLCSVCRHYHVLCTCVAGKAFDITYVRIRFMSPRPESFAIYKRSGEGNPWIPYQFYSASCESTYSLPRRGIITRANEDVAICTDEFSDISPLTGGSVAFSTLEGRPSAFEFSESAQLQVWPVCDEKEESFWFWWWYYFV